MVLFDGRADKYRVRSKAELRKKVKGLLERPVPVATARAILRALSDLEYAMIGGHAVTLRGHPRTTEDIDILARAEDVRPIVTALGGVRPRPRAIGGVSIKVKGVPVDIVAPQQPWVGPAIDSAQRTRYGTVISAPFLVLTKMWAMRGEQDDTDVLYVLRRMSPRDRRRTRALVSRYLPNEIGDLDSMLALAGARG